MAQPIVFNAEEALDSFKKIKSELDGVAEDCKGYLNIVDAAALTSDLSWIKTLSEKTSELASKIGELGESMDATIVALSKYNDKVNDHDSDMTGLND